MNLQSHHKFDSRFSYAFSKAWILIVLLATLVSCIGGSTTSIDPDLIQSIRWYTGESGAVDDEKAKHFLESAAADGDVLSVMWVARAHSTGRMGYAADKPRAQSIASTVIANIEALAVRGVGEAQFLLGTAYAESLGKQQDDRLAAHWYRRAAENGHVLAAHNMGNIYFAGTGVSQDDSMAVAWWEKAAQAGDAIPQFRLGEMYEGGRGVERNIDRARDWYQESARRGNTNAEERLRRLP